MSKPKNGEPYRYIHRRLGPERFAELMKLADIEIGDFMYLTGRRFDAVDEFLQSADRENRRAWTPTMGEVLLLEMVAKNPAILDSMFDIIDTYVDEKAMDQEAEYQQRKRERRAA